MPKPEREKIEYEFEDLRRNTDPVPGIVLAQLGFDTDGEADERQEGKQRPDRRAKRKDDDEDDGSRDDDHDDREGADDDLDEDEEVTLSRKELSRQLTETRRRAERKAREDLDDARGEVTEVVDKLSKRLDGIERQTESDSIEAEFAPKIKDLEAKLEAAMEAGNTKEVMALNRQLSDVTADRKIALHDAKTKAAAAARDQDEDDPTQQRGKRKVPRRVQRWIDKQDWFDDPAEAHVKAYLHKVDADLIEDGLSPSEDEYWSKLERRIDKKFPGVLTLTMRGGKTDDDDDEDDDDEDPRARRRRGKDRDDDEDEEDADRDSKRDRQRGAARRSPVSDGGRGGGGRSRDRDDDGGGRRRQGEIRLTKAHLANMRAFGLDPDNKKHVEEYTLEVQRQQKAERR